MAFHHSKIRNNSMCKCKISVRECGHISHSWPGNSQISPIENSHKFVALPTPRQQKIIAEEIENEKHLPNALGYMDGVLCKIPKPKDSGTDFAKDDPA